MARRVIRLKKTSGSGKMSVIQAKRAPRSKKAVTKLVKKVLNSKAETKMVTFFGGPVSNPSPLRNSTGTFTDAAPTSQNQFITSNTTDILKIIPDVAQGTSDNSRNGKSISPVSGSLHCKVMISPVSTGGAGWQNNNAYDLHMVAYLLQSVTFKTYTALAAGNDFNKMLDVGDGTTTNFDGSFSAANLPVEKGYYRLLATKRKLLRSSGYFTGGSGVGISNNNSHPLVHEWKWNYGKHLPKKLVYPEEDVAVAGGQNEPLNSSLFWCVGYYRTDGAVATTGQIYIQQEYTSIMKFKDF